jgi:hypothetical protein
VDKFDLVPGRNEVNQLYIQEIFGDTPAIQDGFKDNVEAQTSAVESSCSMRTQMYQMCLGNYLPRGNP